MQCPSMSLVILFASVYLPLTSLWQVECGHHLITIRCEFVVSLSASVDWQKEIGLLILAWCGRKIQDPHEVSSDTTLAGRHNSESYCFPCDTTGLGMNTLLLAGIKSFDTPLGFL